MPNFYLVTAYFKDRYVEVKVFSRDECNAIDFVIDYILDDIPECITCRAFERALP